MKKITRSADFCAYHIYVITNFCCYNECRYKEGSPYMSCYTLLETRHLYETSLLIGQSLLYIAESDCFRRRAIKPTITIFISAIHIIMLLSEVLIAEMKMIIVGFIAGRNCVLRLC